MGVKILTWTAVGLLTAMTACGDGATTQAQCLTAADCGVDTDCLSYTCDGRACRSERAIPGTTCGAEGLGNCDASGFCVLATGKGPGESCGGATECDSGFCVEGLCCDAACDGPCQRCDGAETLGQCTPRPQGDPGEPGEPGGPGDLGCAPFLCNGSDGACPTVCDDASDCVATALCNDETKQCVPKPTTGDNGEACAAGAECDSGFCVEGLCCDAACEGVCEACRQAATGLGDGACGPVESGTECRAAEGPCDAAEFCNGVTAACPDDVFATAGSACRPSAGDCDLAEVCSGDTAACPDDVFATAGSECRPSAGACDLAEVCSGDTAACPDDVYATAGSECRPSAGDCDLAEVCSGDAAACPDDVFAAAGQPGSPACAGNYLCDGAAAICPSSCNDASDCAGDGLCVDTQCVDTLVIGLSVSATTLPEDGSVVATFEVTSSAQAPQDIAVDIALSGSAAGTDYSLSATAVTIVQGTTSATFTLTPTPDAVQEGDETVIVTISTSAAGVSDGEVMSQTVTIVDDDAPTLDAIDWLSQDRVVGDPSADPYCLPAERREAHISDALGYLRTDAAGDEGGISAQAPTYNSERQRWEYRILTTFDFKPYAESQPGVGGIPNGADVFEAEGQYVSIVGTNDSGGVAGWASSWGDGCQFFDGWISYDRYNVPDFDADDGTSWAAVGSPIEGVSNPTRNGCPANFGATITRWTFVPAFEFAADSTCPGDSGRKVMDTIVSDHDGGNHHEVFYFTDEYGGKSRWERWECGVPYPDHDYITDRCRYNESQSVMHMAYGVDADRRKIVNANGATCYMTDCRDFTTVKPIAEPGYKAAAWHYGAVIYFSGNILRNGDFNNGQDAWNALNTTGVVNTLADGNHYLSISTDTVGWHSVFASSINEFNLLFDADGEEAYLPKYLHWGARIRHSGSGGNAYLALVEWGNPSGEIIDERPLAPSDTWQWVSFHRLLGAATNSLDIRFKLDGMSNLNVDDVYIYISNDPEK